ncbi:MAG TPA: heme-binding protein [Stellaceae bacterium]|nr:heme-binding protein [Stellaceae bacterium]
MMKRFRCCRLVDAAAVALSIGVAAPASAQGLQATHRVTAALALEAVGAAVAHCASQGNFVSAVVVDASGVRQAVLRGDNAGVHTLDSAMGKAYTAASFKAPTGAVATRIMGNPAAAGLAHVPGVLFAQGGLPIKIGDEVVGGIGVGGSPGGEKDEACAQAGLDQISERLK